MRFKAELAAEQLELLYSLIGPISRLSPQAVVYLDREYLRISSRDADGISCFAELTVKGGIFLSHKIDSVAEHNAIVFEIDLIQWRTAMQSIVGDDRRHFGDQDGTGTGPLGFESSITTMKLAKRHGGIPCLCLDGKCADAVEVYHAIPVKVMRAGDMQ
jgi:hypothetical protein